MDSKEIFYEALEYAKVSLSIDFVPANQDKIQELDKLMSATEQAIETGNMIKMNSVSDYETAVFALTQYAEGLDEYILDEKYSGIEYSEDDSIKKQNFAKKLIDDIEKHIEF